MLDKSDGFAKSDLDSEIEGRIAEHCARYAIDPLTAVKHFPVLARRQLLKRFLAHVELFKLALDVPGDIAELGVFRGLGLFTWANLLEAYCIGNRTKTVYGFDNWQGFTELAPQDARPSADAGKVVGGFDPGGYLDEVVDAIAIFDSDRFIPAKPRIKLVRGQIEDTVPRFLGENPGVRFSLVQPLPADQGGARGDVGAGGARRRRDIRRIRHPRLGGRDRGGRRVPRAHARRAPQNLRLDQRAGRVSGDAVEINSASFQGA